MVCPSWSSHGTAKYCNKQKGSLSGIPAVFQQVVFLSCNIMQTCLLLSSPRSFYNKSCIAWIWCTSLKKNRRYSFILKQCTPKRWKQLVIILPEKPMAIWCGGSFPIFRYTHLSNSACPNPKLQTPMIGLVILERDLEHISKGYHGDRSPRPNVNHYSLLH